MNAEMDSVQRAAQEQFGKQSHCYARGHILENVDDVAAAMARIELPAKARVLDVATGAGYTGLYLASRGYNVTLSDLTESMLQRAREIAVARNLTVEVRQHSAEQMPYADGTFELVTCRVAPHHFSSPTNFVSEVHRVLVPGGYFLLIDGSVQDNETEAEEWLHEVEKLRDPSHNRFLTPKTWRELCERSGLAVEYAELHPKKQPDLNWYFDTANTSAENRARVLDLVSNAPGSARRLFKLCEEDGKIVWWWSILTLIARRPA